MIYSQILDDYLCFMRYLMDLMLRYGQDIPNSQKLQKSLETFPLIPPPEKGILMFNLRPHLVHMTLTKGSFDDYNDHKGV